MVQTADGYTVDPRRTSSDARVDFAEARTKTNHETHLNGVAARPTDLTASHRWSTSPSSLLLEHDRERTRHAEVPGLQARFSELLAMPTSNFEPLKVARYDRAQEFRHHYDCIAEGCAEGCEYCETPACNRVVTLFVYLRDCAAGGATLFPHLDPPLHIQPRRGLGVVHFPARMPVGGGNRDSRVGHEGTTAIDEKWICQQWGWTGPLDRDEVCGSAASSLVVRTRPKRVTNRRRAYHHVWALRCGLGGTGKSGQLRLLWPPTNVGLHSSPVRPLPRVAKATTSTTPADSRQLCPPRWRGARSSPRPMGVHTSYLRPSGHPIPGMIMWCSRLDMPMFTRRLLAWAARRDGLRNEKTKIPRTSRAIRLEAARFS